ncbi:hypothetical protein H8356DRAFT_1353600 [Neocallimastix lanati (nom. inval.)]|nr:hypothetical protein H8356DRAFT_1353600 [Neocallimastix sp. JGI-2020a]
MTKMIKILMQNTINYKAIKGDFNNKVIYTFHSIYELNDIDIKDVALQKLTYLNMTGYDMTWASFHFVEVNNYDFTKFQYKRIGYLVAAQYFNINTDVLMLYLSSNKMYETALALNGLDLIDDLLRMMNHFQPYIRKRMAVLLYKKLLLLQLYNILTITTNNWLFNIMEKLFQCHFLLKNNIENEIIKIIKFEIAETMKTHIINLDNKLPLIILPNQADLSVNPKNYQESFKLYLPLTIYKKQPNFPITPDNFIEIDLLKLHVVEVVNGTSTLVGQTVQEDITVDSVLSLNIKGDNDELVNGLADISRNILQSFK